MSRRRTMLFALIAGAVVGSTYLGTSWYRNSQVQQQMELARQELRAVFAATTPQQRQAHARACFGISEPLLGEKEPIAATATLFVIGVAPIAEVTTDVAVPDAKRVEKIPTADLLLITQALFDTGRAGPADQLLDLALGRDDGFREETLVLASAIRMDLGRDADVLRYCDELIALDRTAASPYRMQASVHRLHGRWDHFVQAVEKARARMKKEDPVLQVELIEGYVHIGRFDEAHREFDKLKATHPELIPSMPTLHARLLTQKGDFEKANQVLTDYLKLDPSDTEALVLKGKLLVDTGDFVAAIEILQTALKHDPSAHDAHFQIGQTYARLNQTDLANHHLALHRKLLDSKVRLYKLEQQAAHEPRNVAVRRELAEMYSEIQLPDLAAFWERAANAAEGK
ncbi:MAG: tetratricopeptide repeat protein [Planctomycetes bacterium]|nr:tetratricopeptide repeat protein [Planctomycetota bacterium]